jgi:hypothetical protein
VEESQVLSYSTASTNFASDDHAAQTPAWKRQKASHGLRDRHQGYRRFVEDRHVPYQQIV